VLVGFQEVFTDEPIKLFYYVKLDVPQSNFSKRQVQESFESYLEICSVADRTPMGFEAFMDVVLRKCEGVCTPEQDLELADFSIPDTIDELLKKGK